MMQAHASSCFSHDVMTLKKISVIFTFAGQNAEPSAALQVSSWSLVPPLRCHHSCTVPTKWERCEEQMQDLFLHNLLLKNNNTEMIFWPARITRTVVCALVHAHAHTLLGFVLSRSSWNVCLGCVNTRSNTLKESQRRGDSSLTTAWPTSAHGSKIHRQEWIKGRKRSWKQLFFI